MIWSIGEPIVCVAILVAVLFVQLGFRLAMVSRAFTQLLIARAQHLGKFPSLLMVESETRGILSKLWQLGLTSLCLVLCYPVLMKLLEM
jgi:hypothetical protein